MKQLPITSHHSLMSKQAEWTSYMSYIAQFSNITNDHRLPVVTVA